MESLESTPNVGKQQDQDGLQCSIPVKILPDFVYKGNIKLASGVEKWSNSLYYHFQATCRICYT